MKNLVIYFIAGASCLGALPTAHGAIIASSTFDTDAEGWTIAGDGQNLTWLAMGGNPDGHIRGADQVTGQGWFFNAPAKFRGDVSAAYGGSLTFDLRQTGSGAHYSGRDVVLISGALRLVIDAGPNPGEINFRSYSVPLFAAAGWKINDLVGPDATEAQMQTVLGSLDELRIRGEFRVGSDRGFLDNVVLNSVSTPEPSSLILLGTGSIGLLFYNWRRRA